MIGDEDRIIPAELQRFMAGRAGSQRTVEIAGASHALPVSQPQAAVDVILEAATLPAAAADVPELVGSSTRKDDA